MVVLGWRDTVQLEHEDRRNRLKRLSDAGLRASPEFHESLIARSELPGAFNVDIPVLRVVFPQRVFFDTGRHDLRPEGMRVIEVVAEALRREASDTAVFVAGHTDGRGGSDYNYDLSVRRAATVALALKMAGVRQADVWRIGFGKAVPLVPNDSEPNWSRNRRVEFLFARKPEAVGAWLSKQSSIVCAGADTAAKAECLRDFAALPRVEAVPVLLPKPDQGIAQPSRPLREVVAPPTIDVSRMQPVTTPRADVLPPGQSKEVVGAPISRRDSLPAPIPPPPVTAIITREDRVIVDTLQQRVYVGRPEL